MQQLNTRKIILVTGASRSGKSEFAEVLAGQTDREIIYIATAKSDRHDPEWQARIARHQQRRPSSWQTEIISDAALLSYITRATATQCLLIDSLGTWVTNFLDLDAQQWSIVCNDLAIALQQSAADLIFVGEETGWGVVPAYPLGRLFRDRLGSLSRQIANIADTTYLVAGGHVLNLSLLGQPLNEYKI